MVETAGDSRRLDTLWRLPHTLWRRPYTLETARDYGDYQTLAGYNMESGRYSLVSGDRKILESGDRQTLWRLPATI